MPEKTIKAAFFAHSGGVAFRGQTVDLSKEDVERGEKFGAFDEGGPAASQSPATVPGSAPGDPGGPSFSAEGGGVEGEPDVPAGAAAEAPDSNAPGLTDEQVDALTGDDLDRAVSEAGIDVSTGGSLSDGSLSADEKRAALKAQNAG